MASKQTTIDFILKQMADAGMVSARKMFGEYGIFFQGKMVALVCDDRLFVKPTLAGEEFLGEHFEESPYPGAKPCFLIPRDKWNDGPWLSQLIKITEPQLPPPKPKKPSKASQIVT